MSDNTIELGSILAIDESVMRSTGAAGFGITSTGFVPKPYARLVAEKLSTARRLFGEDVDLTSASVIRKIIELSALGEARTWAALGSLYDNMYVVSATGEALSRLGEELGLPRPHQQARASLKVKLIAPLPSGYTSLTIPRGTRLST